MNGALSVVCSVASSVSSSIQPPNEQGSEQDRLLKEGELIQLIELPAEAHGSEDGDQTSSQTASQASNQNQRRSNRKVRAQRGGVNVKTVILAAKTLHNNRGDLDLTSLIGQPEGAVISSIAKKGTPARYLALRPKITDATLAFPRGAAIIYPKDAAAIVQYGDIFPGSRVLECGLGSGALTCSLLRAVGVSGSVTSVEKREDFLKTARKNIESFFRGKTSGGPELLNSWNPVLADFDSWLDDYLTEKTSGHPNEPSSAKPTEQLSVRQNEYPFDRIILDLLNPWDFVDRCRNLLQPGGVLTCYITTTTQLQTLSDTLVASGNWGQTECFELIRRPWHLEGLSTRPEHQGILHSGFILSTRRVNS